jgi:hypothetical protein
MTTLVKWIINLVVLALFGGVVYLANPTAKAFIDSNYFEYQHRKEVNYLQRLELEGKIKILVENLEDL